MKKLMGTAALAAMIVMGQGISAEAGNHRKQDEREFIAPGQGGENPSGNTNVGLNAGCGNDGEHGDPAESDENNQAWAQCSVENDTAAEG